jgi:hypothetical protein
MQSGFLSPSACLPSVAIALFYRLALFFCFIASGEA